MVRHTLVNCCLCHILALETHNRLLIYRGELHTLSPAQSCGANVQGHSDASCASPDLSLDLSPTKFLSPAQDSQPSKAGAAYPALAQAVKTSAQSVPWARANIDAVDASAVPAWQLSERHAAPERGNDLQGSSSSSGGAGSLLPAGQLGISSLMPASKLPNSKRDSSQGGSGDGSAQGAAPRSHGGTASLASLCPHLPGLASPFADNDDTESLGEITARPRHDSPTHEAALPTSQPAMRESSLTVQRSLSGQPSSMAPQLLLTDASNCAAQAAPAHVSMSAYQPSVFRLGSDELSGGSATLASVELPDVKAADSLRITKSQGRSLPEIANSLDAPVAQASSTVDGNEAPASGAQYAGKDASTSLSPAGSVTLPVSLSAGPRMADLTASDSLDEPPPLRRVKSLFPRKATMLTPASRCQGGHQLAETPDLQTYRDGPRRQTQERNNVVFLDRPVVHTYDRERTASEATSSTASSAVVPDPEQQRQVHNRRRPSYRTARSLLAYPANAIGKAAQATAASAPLPSLPEHAPASPTASTVPLPKTASDTSARTMTSAGLGDAGALPPVAEEGPSDHGSADRQPSSQIANRSSSVPWRHNLHEYGSRGVRCLILAQCKHGHFASRNAGCVIRLRHAKSCVHRPT